MWLFIRLVAAIMWFALNVRRGCVCCVDRMSVQYADKTCNWLGYFWVFLNNFHIFRRLFSRKTLRRSASLRTAPGCLTKSITLLSLDRRFRTRFINYWNIGACSVAIKRFGGFRTLASIWRKSMICFIAICVLIIWRYFIFRLGSTFPSLKPVYLVLIKILI